MVMSFRVLLIDELRGPTTAGVCSESKLEVQWERDFFGFDGFLFSLRLCCRFFAETVIMFPFCRL